MNTDERLERIEQILVEVVRRLPAATKAQRTAEKKHNIEDQFYQSVKSVVIGSPDVSMREVCAVLQPESRPSHAFKMRVNSCLRKLGYEKYRQAKSAAGEDGVQRERWRKPGDVVLKTLAPRGVPTCLPCRDGNHSSCWLGASRAGWLMNFTCLCAQCGGVGASRTQPVSK